MWYKEAMVMTEENFRNCFRHASSNHFSMSSLGGANVTEAGFAGSMLN